MQIHEIFTVLVKNSGWVELHHQQRISQHSLEGVKGWTAWSWPSEGYSNPGFLLACICIPDELLASLLLLIILERVLTVMLRQCDLTALKLMHNNAPNCSYGWSTSALVERIYVCVCMLAPRLTAYQVKAVPMRSIIYFHQLKCSGQLSEVAFQLHKIESKSHGVVNFWI